MYGQCFNPKYICQPYVVQSKGYGVHSATSHKGAFEGGRQVSPLCRRVLTRDNWVLLAIKGFQIPFVGQPVQERKPRVPSFPSEQLAQIQEEVSEGGSDSSGLSFPPNRVLLHSLPGPKKNGQMRPVINLTALNQWVESPLFKMEGLPSLRAGRLVTKKGGLEGCVPHGTNSSRPSVQPPLHCGAGRLPVHLSSLGLACAPWAFTKIMKVVVTLLRSWGIRITIYIDDILIMSESALLAAQHLEVLIHILQCLGFIIKTEKSVMSPTQKLEFLDMMINTNTLLISLPADKVKQIRAESVRISNMTALSACLFSYFLGKLSAAAQAIQPAPLFYRCLQRDLQAALADNKPRNGKPLMYKPEQVTISSDTSQLGWGASCAENHTGGAWSVEEQTMHINSLELLAALLAVKTFLKNASGISVPQCHCSGLYQQHGRHNVEPANGAGKGTMDVGPRPP